HAPVFHAERVALVERRRLLAEQRPLRVVFLLQLGLARRRAQRHLNRREVEHLAVAAAALAELALLARADLLRLAFFRDQVDLAELHLEARAALVDRHLEIDRARAEL